MEMTVIPRADNITHVVLQGHLDTSAVEEIDGRFLAATCGAARPAIVDLAQIDFMASRGIGMLLAGSKGLKKSDNKLVLLNPQPLVDAALRTMKIDRVLPIAYDFENALRIAQGFASATAVQPRPEVEQPGTATSPFPAAAPPAVTPGQLNLSMNNQVADLKATADAADQFLKEHKVSERANYAINLAIDELVTNVIRYAYVDDDPHTIDLQLTIADGQIDLRIVDDGRPFDPRTGPALDLHAEDRQLGGMGLMLVLDMVDRLKYRRSEPHNIVEIRVHAAELQPANNPELLAGSGSEQA